MTFQRENRYIVVKLKDLAPGQEADIREHLTELSAQPVDSLVIERDWPEYEPAWRMIQARVEGATLSPAHIEDGEEVEAVGTLIIGEQGWDNAIELNPGPVMALADAHPKSAMHLMTVAQHERMTAGISAERTMLLETFVALCDYLGIDPQQARKLPGKPSEVFIAAIEGRAALSAPPAAGVPGDAYLDSCAAAAKMFEQLAPTPPASEQQRAVVMPERRTILDPADKYCCKEVACEAWNDALDELLRLNPHLAKGEGV